MSESISEVFVEIAALAQRLGVHGINNIPGCWEYQFGNWYFALNGHSVARSTSQTMTSVKVEPFELYVEYGGFPAGCVTANDGWFAKGAAINEDAFIRALKAEPKSI